MTFQVYKTIKGRNYAYEITSIWNKEKKKIEKKSKYLGVVIDKEKGVIGNKKTKKEKFILDFGDSYLINQFFKETKITQILSNLLKEHTDTFFSLINYKLCYNGAMMYAQSWYEGNYTKILYPKANVSSQRISDFFTIIGEENFQREFFKNYFETISPKKGIIIDGTSLPNQIHNPLTVWGRSGEEIDKQIRFLLVVDKENSMPLLFRILPGNIIDVSLVKNTIKELAQYGVKDYFIYHDAGFFSEDNIKEYYANNINFLTRLPATRTLYKELIKEEAPQLEKLQNGIRYGKRGLFVKERVIDLFGKKVYAYIVQDLKRKARELERYIIENLDDKQKKKKDQEYDFVNNGIMILVSSFQLPKEDVVPAYYVRQTAEMLFGFSKDDLGLLPLRVHNKERIQGFLFLQFISLIYFIQLKNKLGKDYTVEEVLLSMKNLKCKVYENEILINELTREQKKITKKLSIMVPNFLGI